jgi:hypothetical protein
MPSLAAAKVLSRPHSTTADVVMPVGGAEGVLLSRAARSLATSDALGDVAPADQLGQLVMLSLLVVLEQSRPATDCIHMTATNSCEHAWMEPSVERGRPSRAEGATA